LWGFLNKLGVVVPAGTGAVTAANQEEMFDSAGFDRLYDLVGDAQDSVAGEAGHNFSAAVDAAKGPVFRPAAEFKGLVDNRGKILYALFPCYVFEAGEADGVSGEKPVRIRSSGRLQALVVYITGPYPRILSLVLPGGAKLPFRCGIL
jgi:hypothetical protein